MHLSCNPVNPILSILPKRNETIWLPNDLYKNIRCSLIYNGKKLKIQIFITKMDKHIAAYLYNAIKKIPPIHATQINLKNIMLLEKEARTFKSCKCFTR